MDINIFAKMVVAIISITIGVTISEMSHVMLPPDPYQAPPWLLIIMLIVFGILDAFVILDRPKDKEKTK